MTKDYYNTLGISKGANQDEIKSAYKKLAKQLHPDVNKDPGATEKFKEINEAASVLLDEKKRAQYDQFGSDAFKYGPGGAGPQQGFGGDFAFSEEFDFTDLFDQFFGGGMGGSSSGRQHRRRRGSDLQTQVSITLEDAASGIKKTITVEKETVCETCEGKGGSHVQQCTTCHGSGLKRTNTRTPFGVFQTQTTCPTCKGTGEEIKDICKKCHGKGTVEKEKKLEIDIPAGIEHGTQLRMREEGEEMPSGESGDLYVQIIVKKHPLFERDGDDILIDVPISVAQAALGDEIEIPTLKGKADLKIPAGTQPGTVLRMKGKGIAHMNSFGAGDQLAKVVVRIPESLTRKQEELLKEFASLSKEKPHASLFEKIKKAF